MAIKEIETIPLPEVVCLVFMKDGKLLLEQRLEDDKFKGRWTFTGGKVEEQDRTRGGVNYLEYACKREAYEEINLRPRSFECLCSFVGVSRNGSRYLFHGIWIPQWRG